MRLFTDYFRYQLESEFVMSLVQSEELNDSPNLGNLEPLLNRIFSTECQSPYLVPAERQRFETHICGVLSDASQQRHAQFDELLQLKAETDLLKAQLDYLTKELQRTAIDNKWLKTQLAAKEDQVKFLPHLLERAGKVTVCEQEAAKLKSQLEEFIPKQIEKEAVI